MEAFPLPDKIDFVHDEHNPHRVIVTIEPCYPGYGSTLGNALRRVLLSSMPGAAITKVKIAGVQHEFSTIANTQEDVVDLLLNIKHIRVKLHEGESATMTLHAKGEKRVTAKDIVAPSNVEIMNPELTIATLTDKSAELDIEFTVQEGRGYIPVEALQGEKAELGVISLDAIYTPIKNVNFDSENVRVGQMTNYDKLTLDIATDGTISPVEAFQTATDLLVQHFAVLHEKSGVLPKTEKTKIRSKKKTDTDETAEIEQENVTP